MLASNVTSIEINESYISQETVKEALNALLYSSCNRAPNLLENMEIVQQLAADPAIPLGTYKRSYALYRLLTSLITDELTRHRQAAAIPTLGNEQTLQDARNAIAHDARTSNPELISWSWLYYHFVRIEFNLSPKDFCQIAHIEERTLRRYQEHVIWRLTQHLMAKEQHVREVSAKRYLYTQLPTMTPVTLFGRSASLRQADIFFQGCIPRQFLVTGAMGIGKTVFVQEVIRGLIDRGLIDHLLWVETSGSVEQIYHKMSGFLQTREIHLSIREYLSSQPMVLVLDNADCLGDDLENLERLLNDFSMGVVYLTTRFPLPLNNLAGHIRLGELQPSDAINLIRATLNRHYREDGEAFTEREIGSIWKQASGNPAAIKQAIFKLIRRDTCDPFPHQRSIVASKS